METSANSERRATVKAVLASSPKDPEANAMLADILEHDGERAAARQHARMALAGNPDLLQAHVVLGRIYLAEQQPKLAIAELRQSPAPTPTAVIISCYSARTSRLAMRNPPARHWRNSNAYGTKTPAVKTAPRSPIRQQALLASERGVANLDGFPQCRIRFPRASQFPQGNRKLIMDFALLIAIQRLAQLLDRIRESAGMEVSQSQIGAAASASGLAAR